MSRTYGEIAILLHLLYLVKINSSAVVCLFSFINSTYRVLLLPRLLSWLLSESMVWLKGYNYLRRLGRMSTVFFNKY